MQRKITFSRSICFKSGLFEIFTMYLSPIIQAPSLKHSAFSQSSTFTIISLVFLCIIFFIISCQIAMKIFIFKIVITITTTPGISTFLPFLTLEHVSPSPRLDTQELFCGIPFQTALSIVIPYILLKLSIKNSFLTLHTPRLGLLSLLL